MRSTNRVCECSLFDWKGISAYLYRLGVLMLEAGLRLGCRLFLLNFNENQAMLANDHGLIYSMT